MEPGLELRDDAMMSIDQTVPTALAVVRALRRNDGTVAAPLPVPDGLLLPKAVFPPFWSAYPTLGRGAGERSTGAARRLRMRIGADGPEAVYLHRSPRARGSHCASWPG